MYIKGRRRSQTAMKKYNWEWSTAAQQQEKTWRQEESSVERPGSAAATGGLA
jgi:hypothetical protein